MQYLTPSEKEKLLRAVYSETGKHRKRLPVPIVAGHF